MRHWTAAERQRQAQLIKQWQPWQYSTGARTIEGKAIASQNAFKGAVRQQLKELQQVLRDQRSALNEIS
jgi:hypothetical protein